MLLVNTGSCYVKFIPFLVNSSQIKKCIYFFGSKKFAPNNEQAERIVEDCVYVCRRNSKIYFSIFTLTVLSWNVTPIFEKEQKLAIDIWLPCDLTTRPVLFYTLYIFCAAVIFYLGLTTTPIELILAGLPYHATGQLKILEHNLCNLGIVKNGSDFRITFENAEKVLRECISLHNNILNFVGEFEDCFSWILFFQIAATTFGLCFCCIGFTSNNELRDAIYLGPWYRYDVKIRKTLLIIMERSKVPITLTAGKVVNLDYGIFTWALKTSYSLIAVLKSF
ncbi:odorant receptor 43a-like [Zophobas morio]|uniref:odorant receptor 43a-like n=1 Tax=Zophobas morio TaxID=2755281 RepID=UPI003082A3E6